MTDHSTARALVEKLIQSAREREAASRLPLRIDEAQRRLDEAQAALLSALTPPEGDRARELAIGLGQVRYILKSVANGDDQREVAPRAVEIVESAIEALTPPEVSGVVERVRAAIYRVMDQRPFVRLGQDTVDEIAHAAIAALQSRVSPQEGLREPLEPIKGSIQ